jgi:hypothetical protein
VAEVALIFEFPVDPVFAFTLILEKTPKFLAGYFQVTDTAEVAQAFSAPGAITSAGNEAQNK